MESFSALKNLARVAAGFKGGPFFSKPFSGAVKHTFKDGWPVDYAQRFGAIKQGTPGAPYGSRKPK